VKEEIIEEGKSEFEVWRSNKSCNPEKIGY